jgi:dihydroorotate dehydrogenase (fumarate)
MSVDLRTRYLGLDLANPVVAAASPLTGSVDSLRELEGAGVGAVVLRSLFEEQIEHEEMAAHDLFLYGAEISAEVTGYFPELEDYNTGPDAYLGLIEGAKRALAVPVIASLNGHSAGGWTRYASLFEDSGADAIELNVYFLATDPNVSSAEVEQRYVDLVASVVEQVKVPVSVKIGPFFSSVANVALRIVDAGASGLVLFNRFLQPDVILEDLEVAPRLVLSTSEESRLALRWIAILRGHTEASLAASSGVHRPEDALKLLLAGADVVQIASSLIQRGPYHVESLLRGMQAWLEEGEYESVAQMRGSLSQRNVPDPEAFERSNYMRALVTYTSERT